MALGTRRLPEILTSSVICYTSMLSRTALAVKVMEFVKNDFLGARASRPHKAWHNRGYLRRYLLRSTAN